MPKHAVPRRPGPAVYDLWEVPGKPVSVFISRHASRRILKRGKPRFSLFRSRGPETGGILLGRVEGDGERRRVIVEAAVGVASEHLFGPQYSLSEKDKQRFRATLEKCIAEGGRLAPVGFYRTHMSRGFGLRPEEDLQLFSEFFGEPSSIVLLFELRKIGRHRAAAFFREDGAVHSEASYREIAIGKREAKLPAPAADKKKAARARGPKVPFWCSWWVQAPLLLCLLAADGLLGYLTAEFFNKDARSARPRTDPYALSLIVLEYGDNLHLTWDHKAAAIAGAQRGLLLITDGSQTRTLDLSREQLRNGSVTYRKLSEPVRFRLEVILNHRHSVSETWEGEATRSRAADADAKAVGAASARP
jgi:hypothetical protein